MKKYFVNFATAITKTHLKFFTFRLYYFMTLEVENLIKWERKQRIVVDRFILMVHMYICNEDIGINIRGPDEQ